MLQAAWGQDLASLNHLDLSDTNSQGQLPISWALTMANLSHLDLSSNPGLNGPIPKSWSAGGAFHNLRYLNLSECSLRGPLPGKNANEVVHLKV